ncbi:DUF1302 domain-containing protein [Geobacter argillaceus]|uniref:Uncharacterized protein DUF1302 n=1 Tax=Geobacter argillaceus TaxID=345631 RepID=A0A562VLQ7_9BACT|nr:DUF1302 family protein [Geobacter argillaceus]TWJ18721.1 uncharacterized protein DUF1302 [Geobacter argillaceus]
MALTSLLGGYGSAGAFEIKTGNDDVKVNWDNSIRYNLGYRVGQPDKAIVANPDYDDGERNFRHGIVASRLDLISEFDVSYQKAYGIRLSGAGWYDQVYHNHLSDDLTTSNAVDGNGNKVAINNYTKRYYAGPSGELLDAFAFGKFELAEIPFQIKVGRNTQFWGEGLLLNAALNGISYAQSPLDIAKGYAVPNTSIKELFRPLNNISVTAQPTSTLTIMGQYFLQWEPNRYPESGSYMGIYDFLLNGAQGGFGLTRGSDITPHQIGDWGIGARWSPEGLNGTTLGFYYRNFSDKMPQIHIDTDTGQLRFAYPDNIDLYGISFSQQILGVSVGAEFSYRHNMPLLSNPVAVATAGLPGRGDTLTARGDTLHAVLNCLGLINRTPMFDSAQWIAELNWGNWLHVSQDQFGVFKGGNGYTDIDQATKNFVSIDLNFAPTWFQVFPGADLTLPLSYSRGLIGNSVTNIMQKNAGSWSAGLSVDYLARHKFDLAYVDYFGDFRTDPATGILAVNNGDPALLKDRGTLSFTYRYTF